MAKKALEKPPAPAKFKIQLSLLETRPQPDVLWTAVISRSYFRTKYGITPYWDWERLEYTRKRGKTREGAVAASVRAFHAREALLAQIAESSETLEFDEVPTHISEELFRAYDTT